MGQQSLFLTFFGSTKILNFMFVKKEIHTKLILLANLFFMDAIFRFGNSKTGMIWHHQWLLQILSREYQGRLNPLYPLDQINIAFVKKRKKAILCVFVLLTTHRLQSN